MIGSRDGYRYTSRHRRGLPDRAGKADRRSHANGARCRPSRGARAGRARDRARAMARGRHPGQAGRLAHGRGEASGNRSSSAATSCSSASMRRSATSSKSSRKRRSPDLDAALDDEVGDDLLRLMFISCHPILSPEAGAALTLRLLGGLTIEEIARAFLVPAPTIQQRIVRAKRTLAKKRIPFEVPRGNELAARSASVLSVIYLIFNEGYSATAGDDWMRPQLCEEALRLGRILAELAREEPEVHGLVALMEIQASRFSARTGPSGEPGASARPEPRTLGSAPHPPRPRCTPAGCDAGRWLGSRSAAIRCRLPSPPVTRGRAPPRRRTGRASSALYEALAEAHTLARHRAQSRGGARRSLSVRRRGWKSSTR